MPYRRCEPSPPGTHGLQRKGNFRWSQEPSVPSRVGENNLPLSVLQRDGIRPGILRPHAKTHQLHHVGKAVCGFRASHAGVGLNSTPTCLNPPASTHLPQQCNRRHRKSRHQRCAPDSDSMHGAKTIRTYRSAVARHARAGPPSEARPSFATFRSSRTKCWYTASESIRKPVRSQVRYSSEISPPDCVIAITHPSSETMRPSS